MQVLPQVRLTLARHPLLYWLGIAVLALGVGASVAIPQARLRAQQRSWGRAVPVWVADGDVRAGEPLRTVRRMYPVAVVPETAITEAPAHANAIRSVAAGAIVVEADLSVIGVAGMVPPGWVALAVPAAPAPHLEVGAQVRLYAQGASLADGTIVITDDEQVVVAVPAGSAAALSLAVVDGVVVVALIRPDGSDG